MDEESTFDVEGPVTPEEGVGLDATATTAGVLADDVHGALAEIERGAEPPEATVADPELAALTRSLRDRPEIAEYLAARTAKHRDRDPPGDVDELVAALAAVGLEAVSPQLAGAVDGEYRGSGD